MAAGTFHTVAREIRHEIDKIKGSRFIASVAPLLSAEEALPLVRSLRRIFPTANHHCWAYRLGAGRDNFRYSDDGEPAGSAGRPILQQIDGRRLSDTIVVVSRIFGGIRLGVGGLVRAYGAAAAAALELAGSRPVIPIRRVRLTFPYEASGAVAGLLAAFGLVAVEARYGASTVLEIDLPLGQAAPFLDDLRERTAGRVVVDGGESGA